MNILRCSSPSVANIIYIGGVGEYVGFQFQFQLLNMQGRICGSRSRQRWDRCDHPRDQYARRGAGLWSELLKRMDWFYGKYIIHTQVAGVAGERYVTAERVGKQHSSTAPEARTLTPLHQHTISQIRIWNNNPRFVFGIIVARSRYWEEYRIRIKCISMKWGL